MGLNNGLWRRGKGRAASRASRTFQPVQNRLSGGMTEPTSAAFLRALSPSLFLFTIVYGGMVVLAGVPGHKRSEEHTSELQSLMTISYAVYCLKKKTNHTSTHH